MVFHKREQMSLISQRLKYTDEKLNELKSAQKTAVAERKKSLKNRRDALKQKQLLVGKVVLERVRRGTLEFDAFLKMMDEGLVLPEERKLFNLD